MGELERHVRIAWNGVLINDCTKEQLIECIEWLAARLKSLESQERAMDRIIATLPPMPVFTR